MKLCNLGTICERYELRENTTAAVVTVLTEEPVKTRTLQSEGKPINDFSSEILYFCIKLEVNYT
jgi:hypothetical protein